MTFVKGQSGNPAGKPVGTKSFTTKVRIALEKIAEGKDYSYEEAFIKSILKNAIVEGDPATQRLIWNYLDGMPVQRLGGETPDQPIMVQLSEVIAKKNGLTSKSK